MARDEEFWTTPFDFGGDKGPASLDQLREGAHQVLAKTWMISPQEKGLCNAILTLLDLLADARGEDRRPPGVQR